MQPLKQNYSFDIIVTKSSLQPNDAQESTNPFKYCIRLFNSSIDVPPNRLFVKHFPSSSLGEFVASPCELVGSLSERGISVTIYENDEMLGCGNCKLSPSLLRRLADQTFSVNEVVPVLLENNKKRVAELDLNIKFSSTQPDLDTRLLPFGCYDVCRPLDKSVNPRDVIFTLGRSHRCAATTCITDERLMSHAGAPFTCMHKKIEPTGKECSCMVKGVKPPPELDAAKEQERKLLKKLLVDLEIDKEKVPTPPSGYERSRQYKRRKGHSSSGSNSYHSIDSCLDPEVRDERQIQELELAHKHALGECPVIKAPKVNGVKYTPPQICPVCQANITWLPRVSACPYCGYKHYEMEPDSEQPFDETATAAEIVNNHFLNTRGEQKRSSSPLPVSLTSKECTCKQVQRLCTRCRVQELCSTTKLQSKLQPKSETVKKAPSTTSQRCKELVKIFTEMRNFYSDKKLDNKAMTDKLLKDCDKECRKGAKKKRHRHTCVMKKALKDLEKIYPSKKPKAKSQKKKKRRVKSKRYTFLVRKDNLRPEVKTHHSCARELGRVPCHMGWLWTASELGRHRCWKPGAIKKPIREIMAYFLRDYPADRVVQSRFHYRRQLNQNAADNKEPLIQHPTLHITKHRDEYVVTLRPLKEPKTLAKAANPYENMKPVVFRICKDPIAMGKRNIKLALKERGYPVCTCKQTVSKCHCRSHIDKKIFAQDVKMLSEEQGWTDIGDTFTYSDLSDSDSDDELEFGVTPPAGIVKPERLRKPDRVNCETQYNENDWAMPTMYPHPASALVQYGGCVTGERKNRFPWILGKGYVHREPKPAKKINKPKQKKKTKSRLKGGFDGAFQHEYTQYSDIQQPTNDWHRSNQEPSHKFYNYNNGPMHIY
ncbi:uncharacterized protein LOC6563770 [Drosophila grimshawi]|uniref:GH18392 n=1 Tax=Drosophila grimshawi TaxID=7222 RepID=B4JET0_DROGR|nr:uncharacterized protein LOC6563770 [Drosophila grimshawi]EDV93211.1 GH18392 [Drosophila grimshawi]